MLSGLQSMFYEKMKHFQRVNYFQTVSEKPGTAQMRGYTATHITQLWNQAFCSSPGFQKPFTENLCVEKGLKFCICVFYYVM